jgi:hypothetical protein
MPMEKPKSHVHKIIIATFLKIEKKISKIIMD